jgi:hypothetical protein
MKAKATPLIKKVKSEELRVKSERKNTEDRIVEPCLW